MLSDNNMLFGEQSPGYNKKLVDAYLESLENKMRKMSDQIAAFESGVSVLSEHKPIEDEEVIQPVEPCENELRAISVYEQAIADLKAKEGMIEAIIHGAQRQADKIIRKAHDEAEMISRDAERRVAFLDEKRAEIVAEMRLAAERFSELIDTLNNP